VLPARDGPQAESTRSGATLLSAVLRHHSWYRSLDWGNHMTSRQMLRLLMGLGLTALTAAPAAAQRIAYSDAAPAPPRAVLADAYYLRLESEWPQATAADATCRNGGDEIVEGTVLRGMDGMYRGSLDRRSLILFCGAHGASGEACELVLEGDGKVAMTGYVVPDETSPSGGALRLSWQPSPTHAAAVRGACSADFKRSVEEMYRSATHGIELAVPAAGAGMRKERLEHYAWTAEVAGR
jgi:hypothetical protein